MAQRLFGMEIEYGCAARSRDAARPVRNRDWVGEFMRIACERLPHLPSMEGGGIFLENGARFYVDCSHPEMTTPECSNPWDVVRYMQAGEKMLTAVAEEMQRRQPSLAEVMIFKTNVDHSGSGATWGCHTSFMHLGNPEKFPDQIIPHLVSRIVYSGAGGLELVDGRFRFTLSPRVRFLDREVSHNSTSERGIFHTKDETLANEGCHRLHIICGESLCSETALWLNMGATAVIVALIEAGLRPGQAVRLQDPLGAMRRFSLDPTCRAVAQTLGGKKLSAVQIQRHYLEMAQTHCGAPFMPPWADQVCIQWRKILDRLENGTPGSVASTLDWAMKLGLFLRHSERRGLGLQHWHHMDPASQQRVDDDEFALSNEEAAACKKPEAASPAVRKVHQELCEIDTRFGQLGDNGIFAALNRAGVLSHQFAGVDNIEHAVANPPAIGRARLRGQCVQRFKGQNNRYSCSWRNVVDLKRNLLLDLSEPFVSEEKWQPAPPGFHDPRSGIEGHLRRMLSQARTLHDRGDHESAATILRQMEGFQPAFALEGSHSEYLRLQAWIQSRRGFLDGINALDELAQSELMNFSLANSYVCAYRYQGLIPPPAIESWIRRGREYLSPRPDPRPDPSDGAALPFLGHWGYFLLRNGQPYDALRRLNDACQPIRRESAIPAALARALADYADASRALGQRSEAVALLDEAQNLQAQHQLEGDLADFALTYRAKLETNSARALELLSQAKAIQTRLGNVMGETRTLLLEARLLRHPAITTTHKARLHELRGMRPALSQCKLLAKILDHWAGWLNGGADPDGGRDTYWWL
jgi:proteasome accessory factor A